MAMSVAEKKEAVAEIIDNQCAGQLDNYIRDIIKNKANAIITNSGDAQDVADEVYDLIYTKYSGDDVQAAMSMQVFPRSGLTYLRTDIIAALTEEEE